MTDKSPIDEQWDDLVSDWQTQPYEKVDIEKLIIQLRKRTLWAKILLGIDVLATIFLFSACYWHATYEPEDVATIIYLGVGAVGSFFYTGLLFRIRLQTWKMDASDPKQYFDKTVNGINGALKLAKLLKYTCYFMVPMINWYLWEVSKTSEKNMLVGYIIANVFIFIMYVASHIYQRRREKELIRLSELIE
jgi:hypothetical protein